MKILVASQNPSKINAVTMAFQEVFPETSIQIEAVSVDSEVPDQPMGSNETLLGAQNRVNNARNAKDGFDFYIGLEGGIVQHKDGTLEAMAWMVVLDKNCKMGKARTAGFFLSPQTAKYIHEGYELGRADELVFGVENSKQKMGSSGLLTQNIITRQRFYRDAIILALIPFINPTLF